MVRLFDQMRPVLVPQVADASAAGGRMSMTAKAIRMVRIDIVLATTNSPDHRNLWCRSSGRMTGIPTELEIGGILSGYPKSIIKTRTRVQARRALALNRRQSWRRHHLQ